MKALLFIGISFLIVNMSVPHALGGPLDPQKKPIENRGDIERERRRITDWDDLLRDPREDLETRSADSFPQASDPTLQKNPQDSVSDNSNQHGRALDQLGKAFRQAYARGDENHQDWKIVAESIEALRPKSGTLHAERRFAVGEKANEARDAEAEELQYLFFATTLPAIKKTSAVAALRVADQFQTIGLVNKTTEEQTAWEQVREEFETVCSSQFLDDEKDSFKNFDCEDPDPFEVYRELLIFQSERLKIERHLNTLHDRIMQKIIQANVCRDGFEERAWSADVVSLSYQTFLKEIKTARAAANPIVEHKWEQFYQETAIRALEDATQVDKIQFWKNRNHAKSVAKMVEEVNPSSAMSSHIDTAFEALEAWQKQQRDVEAFQENITRQKRTLNFLSPTKIEEMLTAAQEEVGRQMKTWEDFIKALAPAQMGSYIEDYLKSTFSHHHAPLTVLQKNADDAYQSANQAPAGRRHAAWKEAKDSYQELLKLARDVKKRLDLLTRVTSEEQRESVSKKWAAKIEKFQSDFLSWEEQYQAMPEKIIAGRHDDSLWYKQQELDLQRNKTARALEQTSVSAADKLEEHVAAWKKAEEEQQDLIEKLDGYSQALRSNSKDESLIQQELVEQHEGLVSTMLMRLKFQQQYAEALMKRAEEQHQVQEILKGGGNPALARYNKEKYLVLASQQHGEIMRLFQKISEHNGAIVNESLTQSIEEFAKKFKEDRLLLSIAPFIKSEAEIELIEKYTGALRNYKSDGAN